MIQMRFKQAGAQWQNIFEETMKHLLHGYFEDNEIREKIDEIKTRGGKIETLVTEFRIKK